MNNTPITDELAREFSGKRLSSREAGSVWSLCRDLERELNKVITALAQSKEANAGLMRACDKYESELADAKETIAMLEIRHGATMLCHEEQMDAATKQRDALAEALREVMSNGYDGPLPDYARNIGRKALAAMKGGSDE